MSGGTVASIAQALRVDPPLLVSYFGGATTLEALLAVATVPPEGERSARASSSDAVAPGELANVAATVFKSADYDLRALDTVRGWLAEIERSGDADVLDDAEAAEYVTEQLFDVAASTAGSRTTLVRALLRVCVRLAHVAETVPDGVDPEFFVRQRRAKMHAAKLASTRERHTTLIASAKAIYEAMPEDERAKLGSPAARFVNGEMHDGESRWRATRDAFVALGAKDVPL